MNICSHLFLCGTVCVKWAIQCWVGMAKMMRGMKGMLPGMR